MSRDFVTEMRAVIDAEATGTYVPAVVAVHIAEKLRETEGYGRYEVTQWDRLS